MRLNYWIVLALVSLGVAHASISPQLAGPTVQSKPSKPAISSRVSKPMAKPRKVLVSTNPQTIQKDLQTAQPTSVEKKSPVSTELTQKPSKATIEKNVPKKIKNTQSVGPQWLIIPVYLSPDTTFMWEVDNPFAKFFVAQETAEKGRHGSLGYQLPLGDLRDISTLRAENIFTGHVQPVSLAIERYHAVGLVAIIVRSTDEVKNSCDLQVKVFNRSGLVFASEPVSLKAQPQLEEVFKQAQDKAFKMVLTSKTLDEDDNASDDLEEHVQPPEDAGIPQTPDGPLNLGSLASPVRGPAIDHVGAPGPGLFGGEVMEVAVTFDSFENWQRIRHELAARGLVQDFQVLELARDHATVTFRPKVPLGVLRERLQTKGLALTEDSLQRWQLHRQGSLQRGRSPGIQQRPEPTDVLHDEDEVIE